MTTTTYEITAPDGRTFDVTVPEGTTREQALEFAKTRIPQTGKTGSYSGMAMEAIKGFPRGGGLVAEQIPRHILPAMLGPVIGGSLARGVEAVTAPSKEVVRATPASESERFVGTASELAGASVVGGGASRPVMGVALPSIAGAVGEQVAGEPGKAIGSLSPLLLTGAAAVGRKLAPSVTAEKVEQFKRVGAPITVGQATESRFIDGLENLLAKIPGGYWALQKFGKEQQQLLAPKTTGLVGAEVAGRTIESGITGKTGFLNRTKEVWNKLDDAVAAKVSPASTFAPTNTIQTLNELTNPSGSMNKTLGGLVSPKLKQMAADLAEDMKAEGGGVGFQALRNFRSRIGVMLDDSIVANVAQSDLKRLYGAISKDLEAAAKSAGPEAHKAFNRQNAYWAARQKRVEDFIGKVVSKDAAEDIYIAATSKSKEGGSKIRAIMRSLSPAEREVVSNTVVDRLGRAPAGKQLHDTDVFSTETFLTNWEALSPQAKQQLFTSDAMRRSLDDLASIATNIREGSQVFKNPSGTAGALFVYGLGTSMLIGAATATPSAVVWPATVYAGSLGMSKLMTNQKFVTWLSQLPKMQTDQQAAAHLARLSVIFKDSEESVKEHITSFVDGFNRSQQGRQ